MNKPVSKLISKKPFLIESPYYYIKYRPTKDNIDLNICCEVLLSNLAYYDYKRSDILKEKLYKVFYKSLKCCNTDEELEKFNLFLLEITNHGGYAVDFYNEIKNNIRKVENKNDIFIKKDIKSFYIEYLNLLNVYKSNVKINNSSLLEKFKKLKNELNELKDIDAANYIELNEKLDLIILYLKKDKIYNEKTKLL